MGAGVLTKVLIVNKHFTNQVISSAPFLYATCYLCVWYVRGCAYLGMCMGLEVNLGVMSPDSGPHTCTMCALHTELYP